VPNTHGSFHHFTDDLLSQSLDWCKSELSERGLTSPPTQYRLCVRQVLQVKRPNQQCQSSSTEGTQK